jgi:tRNA pseudouridine(38-40) synthase
MPPLFASLRRSIPSVENFDEQQVRELWERDPFDTAKKVVDKVLKHGFGGETPLSKRLEQPLPSSGYEDYFDPLYNKPKGWESSENNPRDKCRHFLLSICYLGDDFCGWQRQPNNEMTPSVQQTIEDWLGTLEESKVKLKVCGRTDLGVHALSQVCRFRTRNSLSSSTIQTHLDKIPHSGIRCTSVTEVTRAFHPVFSATCRAYSYMIEVPNWNAFPFDRLDLLNDLLRGLEGRELDYIGLSYGRLKTLNSNCILYHARASRLKTDDSEESVLCIELVGNRFLRRMVRLLVDATLRLIHQSEPPSKDALLRHVQKADRGLIVAPAPPDGLMFVGAGFNSWN